MSYWIGYKLFRQTSNLYVESFGNYEEAMKHYGHLKKTALPGEVITPPFLAWSEDDAREEAKKLMQY